MANERVHGKVEKLTAASHEFFDEVVGALATTSFLDRGAATHATKVVGWYGDTMLESLACRSGEDTLAIVVTPAALDEVAAFRWPASLDVRYMTSRSPAPAPITTLDDFQRLHAAVWGQAFVAYFERIRGTIDGRYGKIAQWPEHMQFARTFRNAVAHRGVHITDTTPPGRWRQLAYTAADEGRQILYRDMSPADLVLLMLEVNDTLSATDGADT